MKSPSPLPDVIGAHWGSSSRESEPGQGGCAEGKAVRSVLGVKHNLGQTVTGEPPAKALLQMD